MSGILFMGNDDFQVRRGDRGDLLALTYEPKGLTLILFYSIDCPHCDTLLSKFKYLPNHINGCRFGMVNINKNMSVVERSRNTIAPITYVPDMILYVGGLPYVRYDGPHDIEEIKTFILNIYQKIQKTSFVRPENESSPSPPQQQQYQQQPPPPSSFSQQQPSTHAPISEIPEYTIGRPYCGDSKKDGVCYLNFDKAYVSAS